MPPKLWLASGSPRRRAFLEQLGFAFDVDPADIDETPRPHETASGYVSRLAKEKAETAAKRHLRDVVLAADTTVSLDGALLGKPTTPGEAEEMLAKLSEREHSVWTGVALAGSTRALVAVETRVRFRAVSPAERRWYAATGEPMDKAGGYAVQGLGAVFVQAIFGSHTNVAGLPLAETIALLADAGVAFPWGTP